MGKSKYESHVLPKLEAIQGWARNGVSEENIANNLNVGYSTFREYKAKNPALVAALSRAREEADLVVEGSLYRKANGYNAQIIKHYRVKESIYDPQTGKKIKEVEKLVEAVDEVHVPADTNAQIFWLANRKRNTWSKAPDGGDDADDGSGVIEIAPVQPEQDGVDLPAEPEQANVNRNDVNEITGDTH